MVICCAVSVTPGGTCSSEDNQAEIEGNSGLRESLDSADKHASANVLSEGKMKTRGERGHNTIGK